MPFHPPPPPDSNCRSSGGAFAREKDHLRRAGTGPRNQLAHWLILQPIRSSVKVWHLWWRATRAAGEPSATRRPLQWSRQRLICGSRY